MFISICVMDTKKWIIQKKKFRVNDPFLFVKTDFFWQGDDRRHTCSGEHSILVYSIKLYCFPETIRSAKNVWSYFINFKRIVYIIFLINIIYQTLVDDYYLITSLYKVKHIIIINEYTSHQQWFLYMNVFNF